MILKENEKRSYNNKVVSAKWKRKPCIVENNQTEDVNEMEDGISVQNGKPDTNIAVLSNQMRQNGGENEKLYRNSREMRKQNIKRRRYPLLGGRFI